MKIVTWNVNGIRAILKKEFEAKIAELAPDILCLQETKAEAAMTEDLLQSLGDYTIHAREAERKGYSGTAIASKAAPEQITHPEQGELSKEGRIQCADFGDFYLVNVYVPNSGNGLKRLDYREEWDADFLEYLKGLQEEKPLILCGDLNVAHQAIDLKNDKSNYNKTAGFTQVEIDGMDRLQQAGLVDVFRKLNPETEAYTYWSYRFNARQKNIGWRIDYFLVSEELLPRVKGISIHKELEGSDHCPVVLELD
ncbi:exodeoxyribonuclease-3 [Robiginitalea myxolifaciens]|uniref:Exodeoxyribonuclease-3 n=1 Tax=Robiginitalea myxolifaciens TaxID=400055 RepID=A0A1I6H2R4_9FLAO|nr:exodeoxyribonuclease III [Robiginitalea myxolifaciens]SFR48785.1 exodeoxyribonuclease-3 [Robiginitalea myxolifaciens]